MVTIEGSWLPVIWPASANQKSTNDVLHENPEQWLPYLPDKPVHSNKVKNCWFLNKRIRKRDGTCLLMIRGISCNQTTQKTFIWKLYSESTHHTVHQSTQYHMVTRFKAWENVTMGSGGIKFSSVWNHFFYFRHCGPPVFPQPPASMAPCQDLLDRSWW